MGPSGSGKSTFMNLIGCLDTPTSGSYRLDGEDVAHMDRDELAACATAGSGSCSSSSTCCRARRRWRTSSCRCSTPASRRRRGTPQRAASSPPVGLADRWHHHPAQLSGGQQQRVAIARALVNDPKLILADEPTGALDSATSLEVMALLQELNRSGITIVVVTHEHDIAAFASRLLTFRDGRLIVDAPNAPEDAAPRWLPRRGSGRRWPCA